MSRYGAAERHAEIERRAAAQELLNSEAQALLDHLRAAHTLAINLDMTARGGEIEHVLAMVHLDLLDKAVVRFPTRQTVATSGSQFTLVNER